MNEFRIAIMQEESVPSYPTSSDFDVATTTTTASSSALNVSDTFLKQPMSTAVVFAVAYSIVFFVGVIGNMTVVLVVIRNPRLHSVTNCFIVNLAVADMLVVILCVPANLISNLFSGWHLGSVMCKMVPFLQGISVAASSSTLTAISIDRYLAICHPLKRWMTRRVVRYTIGTIWILSSLSISPWLVNYTLVGESSKQKTVYICYDSSSQVFQKIYFFSVIFLMCYSVPLVCIVILYTLIAYKVWNRNAELLAQNSPAIYSTKVKVIKMLITVVVLFITFWMPLYAIHIRGLFSSSEDRYSDPFIYQTLVPIAQWLSSSNSSVNPLVYCLFSKKFRSSFTSSTCCGSNSSSSATTAAFVRSRWTSDVRSVNASVTATSSRRGRSGGAHDIPLSKNVNFIAMEKQCIENVL